MRVRKGLPVAIYQVAGFDGMPRVERGLEGPVESKRENATLGT